MQSDIITWGTCKGKRGYWEWHKGHVKFRLADEAPKQHGVTVIKDIEPYQNIAIDKGVIGSRRAHREMLKRHDLVEVGNEKPREHPRDTAAQRFKKAMPEIVESLKKNSQGKWL